MRLEEGTLTMAADEGAASVEVAGERVRLERGAVATLALSAAGRPEAVVVEGQVQASGSPVRRATERERAMAWHALDETRPDPDAPIASPPPVPGPRFVPPEDAPPASSKSIDGPAAAATTPAPARARAPAPIVDEPVAVMPEPVSAPALAGNSDSEPALLAAALAKLRREGDAVAALALLERDLSRHPDGVLVPEIVAVEVEAWLARGEDTKALETLDALPTARVPLDRRLRALRGELRAKAGRCAEAKGDFSATLRAPPSDAVDERVLRGRAACAALAHDDAALRADLDTYVRRFPARPFAEEGAPPPRGAVTDAFAETQGQVEDRTWCRSRIRRLLFVAVTLELTALGCDNTALVGAQLPDGGAAATVTGGNPGAAGGAAGAAGGATGAAGGVTGAAGGVTGAAGDTGLGSPAGGAAGVSVAPTDAWVFFDSLRGLDRDIYAIKGDGTSLSRVTNSSANEREPAVSPDGKTLAYSSDESGTFQLYLKDLPDGTPRALTAGGQPAWSREGHQLAFSAGLAMFVITADGNGVFDGDSARLIATGIDMLPDAHPAFDPSRAWARPTSNQMWGSCNRGEK